jgi:DUF4097 and DUF4098 domain-containing protein YvlB
MGKVMKIWLVSAVILILLGVIAFISVMTLLEWDFKRISSQKMETNKYEIDESFADILLGVDTAEIEFLVSADSKAYVECYEREKEKHSVKLSENTLKIELDDTRKWYDYIGFNFTSPKIKVSLPIAEYRALKLEGSTGDVKLGGNLKFSSIDISGSTGDVYCASSSLGDIKIKMSTGDVYLENVSTSSLDVSVSTGRVDVIGAQVFGDITLGASTGKSNLKNVSCKNLVSSASTGKIALENVVATEKLSIERDTGDVKLIGSDASEIFINVGTGDVSGTLLSDKVFIVSTSTGEVDVPRTAVGGRCEITTSTGDVSIKIQQ